MTPCSAAAVGSDSRRLSSRSACLRTSSGSATASRRSRRRAASSVDSSNSPSSAWIALSCWRRTNSRWPLSISDWTWDWIFEPIEMTSSSRCRPSTSLRSRAVTSTSSSSACFSSVFIRSDPAMRCESVDGSSMFDTASRSSSGRYGTSSTIRENVSCTVRMSAVSFVECCTTSGSSVICATR